RALANDPPIVLADEPTGNLDTANGRHIMDLLRTVHTRRGSTVVLVTHDAELAAMADARLVLRDGRVVENTVDRGLRIAECGSSGGERGLGVRQARNPEPTIDPQSAINPQSAIRNPQ